jgi:hypothetical protein
VRARATIAEAPIKPGRSPRPLLRPAAIFPRASNHNTARPTPTTATLLPATTAAFTF